MNPFMMQQKKVPKITELWKDEVNKYRLWIILFFVGVAIITILSLTAIILNGIGMNNGLIEQYRIALNKEIPRGSSETVTYEKAKFAYISSLVIIPSLMVGLVIISILLLMSTIIKSYKSQNFANISRAGIFIIQLSAFFALMNVFQYMFSGLAGITAFPGSLYSTIVMFLYLPIWYFANKVSRIRKLFIYSQRVNSPEFQQQMEQMKQQFANASGQNFGGNSPFGFTPGSPKSNTTSAKANNKTTQTPTQQENINKPEISETDRQLSKLNMTQLRSIAKKLYISGHETMNRDELITHIKRSTNK